ncbi:hypothetical protein KP509_30G044400 [Ceratopteris richardii]|uniref:Elongator complex protein 6 n=1 Tax=Ceratopteris richardii TaxID=49495 RepID=A0A8T2R2Y2_CERRI|nr:hypothetical protein KP509_30G044400 [Ceratopteris richardii]
MLDDVLGWGGTLPRNRVLLVKDTVAASASFLLLYLLKKILATPDSLVIFVGLKEPFSHYSRIARKQGCNLAMHQDHGSLVYIDLLSKTILEHSSLPTDAAVINEGNKLILLFQKFIRILKEQPGRNTWIIIDDISLIEVIAQGNNAHVRDFLHYCRTLATDQQICSLLLLTHLDAYEDIDETMMANHLELLSDTVINVVPLVTGQAVDVHGQVIVEHKVPCNVNPNTCMDGFQNSRGYGLHYKLMENTVQFFTPGKHV